MKHLRLISLLVALLSVSCIAQYRAEGPVESRSVVLTGTATAIAVSHDVDVVVDATLAQNEAHIMTHSDVIDFVKVYIEDETLYVKLDASRSISTNTLEVRIPKFDYSSLAISAGAEFSDRGYGGAELVIAASAGAEVDVYVTESLVANVSAGAQVSYKGNPQSVEVSKSAGGSVERDND